MPIYTRHEVLLQTFCDLMSAADAERIGTMDPTDYVTFVEAYCATRHLPDVTDGLRRVLIDAIFTLMDAETALFMQKRRSQQHHSHHQSSRVGRSNVIQLPVQRNAAPEN